MQWWGLGVLSGSPMPTLQLTGMQATGHGLRPGLSKPAEAAPSTIPTQLAAGQLSASPDQLVRPCPHTARHWSRPLQCQSRGALWVTARVAKTHPLAPLW